METTQSAPSMSANTIMLQELFSMTSSESARNWAIMWLTLCRREQGNKEDDIQMLAQISQNALRNGCIVIYGTLFINKHSS